MIGLSERLGFKKDRVEEDSIKVVLHLDST